MNVLAALLNESSTPRRLGGNFRLQICSSNGPPEVIVGPRSTESIAVAPGEEVEFAGWRLGEDTLDPGHYLVSVIYEPAGLQPIHSGTLGLSIGDKTAFEESPRGIW